VKSHSAVFCGRVCAAHANRGDPNVHDHRHALVRDLRFARDAQHSFVKEDFSKGVCDLAPCGRVGPPRLESLGEKWRITATAWLASMRLAPSKKSWFGKVTGVLSIFSGVFRTN
jgi:hypothetical protein